MNSTAVPYTKRIPLGCVPPISQGTLDETSSEAYGWLIFIAVISIITCPFTAVMNALGLSGGELERIKLTSPFALHDCN